MKMKQVMKQSKLPQIDCVLVFFCLCRMSYLLLLLFIDSIHFGVCLAAIIVGENYVKTFFFCFFLNFTTGMSAIPDNLILIPPCSGSLTCRISSSELQWRTIKQLIHKYYHHLQLSLQPFLVLLQQLVLQQFHDATLFRDENTTPKEKNMKRDSL